MKRIVAVVLVAMLTGAAGIAQARCNTDANGIIRCEDDAGNQSQGRLDAAGNPRVYRDDGSVQDVYRDPTGQLRADDPPPALPPPAPIAGEDDDAPVCVAGEDC